MSELTDSPTQHERTMYEVVRFQEIAIAVRKIVEAWEREGGDPAEPEVIEDFAVRYARREVE